MPESWVDIARSDLMYAAAFPGRPRSADAIHLATAIRLQTGLPVAYDGELLAAAVDAGVTVLGPRKIVPSPPPLEPQAA
ncbi:hypothetical protein ACSVHC_05140 [Arthrobacter sp. KNU-44]|uniref:hypothetical protein n=1 Tax=unclassified Arthrobacter TaxID=235627 RepID=UPI003F43DFEF